MAKQEPLYDLIQSLSQTEKRYFKVYSSKQESGDDKNYVHLFEIIEKMKRYDENSVLQQIKNPKYISQQKRHLRQKIMESLRAYHAAESVEVEINSLIHDFHILLDKSLLKQSRKVLNRAKKLAVSNECFTEIIKINKLETQQLRAEEDLNELNQHIEEVQGSVKHIVSKIENQIAFEKEYINLIKWNKEIEMVRHEGEVRELRKILSQPMFYTDNNALSAVAKLQFYYIKGLYYFFLGEFKSSFNYFKEHLLFFENHPSFIQNQPLNYTRAIGNYTLLALKTDQFTAFEEGLTKLKGVSNANAQHQQYINYIVYMFTLMYYTQVGWFQKAVDYIEKHKDNIQPIDDSIVEHNFMYIERNYVTFKSILAYIGVGNYKAALKYVNDYLNSGDADLKKDSYCMAQIISLFIHYELGNDDLLEYSLTSTERFLSKRDRLYEFEVTILKFIKKAITINNEFELMNAFKTLKYQLQPLATKVFEKNVFEYLDFIAWLDSKITGRSFKEIVESKFAYQQLPIIEKKTVAYAAEMDEY